jgi:hypothetical protein
MNAKQIIAQRDELLAAADKLADAATAAATLYLQASEQRDELLAALAIAKADADNWFRQYNAMKCAGSSDIELEVERLEQELAAEREKVKPLVEALEWIVENREEETTIHTKAQTALAQVKEGKPRRK